MSRPSIPQELERRVLVEAGHRCAIPTCRHTRVEIAHIIPWAENKAHEFENLIALCPNCHDLFDKDKRIDRKSMQIYKANLGVLNQRYGEFERRLLQYFCTSAEKRTFLSVGLEPLVYYFLKDGILKKTGNNSGFATDDIFTSEEYALTELGEELLQNWKEARLIE